MIDEGIIAPKMFYSSVIPASIDRVWAHIRDFNEMRSWHPAFRESSIEEGSRAIPSVVSGAHA